MPKSIVILLDSQHPHSLQLFSQHSWYKSYVRMVRQGGHLDFHYSLSTNRFLLHHSAAK